MIYTIISIGFLFISIASYQKIKVDRAVKNSKKPRKISDYLTNQTIEADKDFMLLKNTGEEPITCVTKVETGLRYSQDSPHLIPRQ